MDSLIEELEGYSINDVKMASAELNCLLTWIYSNNIKESDCCCYLLYTDTYFGELAAELICDWLKKHEFDAIMQKIENLNTLNIESFEDGVSCFAKWAFDNAISNEYQKVIIYSIQCEIAEELQMLVDYISRDAFGVNSLQSKKLFDVIECNFCIFFM